MAAQKEGIPAIIGLGSSHGGRVVTNEQLATDLFPNHDPERAIKLMDRFMRPTGIKSRYWVSHEQLPVDVSSTAINPESLPTPLMGLEQSSSDMATEALIQALDMAGVERGALKTIVVGSGSQDYRGVAIAGLVQNKLGLGKNVRAFDVYAACPGWLQALYTTFTDLSSPIGYGGPQVAIGAETISPILSKEEQQLYPLFGDAAGATVVDIVEPDAGAPTNMGFSFGADGSLAQKLYMPGGGSKHPTTHTTVDQNLHTLKMDGALVKDHAVNNMASATRLALEKAGIPVEEVTLLIPHQANLEIMKATADAVGVPYDKMIVTIDHYGNTSAASIPTAMREAWDNGRLNRNDMLAVATFGAGFIFGAAILPMVGLPKR